MNVFFDLFFVLLCSSKASAGSACSPPSLSNTPSTAAPYPSPSGGWVHGIAWIAFVLACVAAAIRFRWTWWALPTGIIASMLPFLTVPFDLWMERTGRLSTANRPANHVQTTAPHPLTKEEASKDVSTK